MHCIKVAQNYFMWFFNQALAGMWPVRTWLLKIDPVRIVGMHVRVYACVCVCMCVSAPEAINN